jgi:pre-mRNA-processing factor SLU7
MASSNGSRMTRDEFKKQKEIEEGRKAGTIAPETDEDGKEINPHIPQYIREAPWYLKKDTPSLKHQKSTLHKTETSGDWYRRGQKTSAAAPVKFRKGACTNCGALSHKTKDCCERPRKLGAKWTGRDLQSDEVVTDVVLDFDGKKDRWNGYDSSMHLKVVEQYQKVAEERKMLREEMERTGQLEQQDAESSDESDDENKDYMEDGSMAAPTKVDSRTRTTIRNLRIREDTAKYLRNLDVNSAYYDPKTRSMRENPNPNANPEEEPQFVGDNTARTTGETLSFAQLQSFAWEAAEHGQEEVHVQAAPSQAALMYEQFKQKKEAHKEKQRNALIAKYGGEEHLEAPDKRLIFAQTDQYVEYSRVDGKAIKGQEKVVARSKYEEDVLVNNHTSVWGSYWENGQWGYGCCHQVTKNSYCTGAAGRLAKENALKDLLSRTEKQQQDSKEAATSSEKASSAEDGEKKGKKDKKKSKKSKKDRKRSKKERRRGKKGSGSDSDSDSDSSDSSSSSSEEKEEDARKKRYNSMVDCSVNDDEMAEWRSKRQRRDDPMANFIGKDAEEDE